jgi:hypothetical protein
VSERGPTLVIWHVWRLCVWQRVGGWRRKELRRVSFNRSSFAPCPTTTDDIVIDNVDIGAWWALGQDASPGFNKNYDLLASGRCWLFTSSVADGNYQAHGQTYDCRHEQPVGERLGSFSPHGPSVYQHVALYHDHMELVIEGRPTMHATGNIYVGLPSYMVALPAEELEKARRNSIELIVAVGREPKNDDVVFVTNHGRVMELDGGELPTGHVLLVENGHALWIGDVSGIELSVTWALANASLIIDVGVRDRAGGVT